MNLSKKSSGYSAYIAILGTCNEIGMVESRYQFIHERDSSGYKPLGLLGGRVARLENP